MPYATGLQSAADAFVSAGVLAQAAVACTALVLILCLCATTTRDPDGTPARLPEHSLFAIVPFYRRRFDFLNWGFRTTGQPVFQFNLLRNTVIAVSGEAGRQAFFAAKGLDLNEGFKVLSGAIPILAGVTSELHTKSVALIHRRLGCVQTSERLTQLKQEILEDCRAVLDSWGPAGCVDPFDKIYELVFQTTVRALSCAEIADDAAVVARLKALYDTLDRGNTPAAVLLPWLPSPAALRNTLATKRIHDILLAAINARVASGVPRADTLQMLLDAGTEKTIIVGFMMGLIIAGSRSTGTTASWLVTFLGAHPDWKARATAEVEGLLFHHRQAPASASPAAAAASPPFSPTASSPASDAHSRLTAQLADIPLHAWENDTPTLDALIRETLRLAQPHVAMRRNVGPDITLPSASSFGNDNGEKGAAVGGATVIPTGAYAVYPFADVHLDPRIYPDPLKWDPARPTTTTTGVALPWIGWGAGKTICAGQRLARLEMKLILSTLLLGFDYAVVDGAGRAVPPGQPPRPDWNDTLTCRPARALPDAV